MKKYFMKFKSIFNKYCNYADSIVLGLTLLSLIWICYFKFFWIEMNPLFVNANKMADINYTICTSIVASGIFYLFTIFIPKLRVILNMKKEINSLLCDIYDFNKLIIERIVNTNTKQKYDYNDFIELLKNNESTAKNEFIKYYGYQQNITDLISLSSFQYSIISYILAKYSNVLTREVFDYLTDIINVRYSYLKLISKKENQLITAEAYYKIILSLISIIVIIKEIYNIELQNETIL